MRSIQFLVALQYTFTSLHFLCCSAFTPPLLARIKCQQTHPSPTCLFSSLSIDSSSKTLTKNGNNSPPEKEGDDDDDDDPLDIIRYHTELAINQRGQPKCLEALQQLAALSQRRISYDFANNSPAENNVGTVVSPLRQLLPPNIIHKFLKQVQKMEDHGWLSTNPDSVDGLPSLHLNLVSGGKPIVPSMMMDGGGDNELDDEFQLGIQQLLQIVHSPIYNSLLPKVHRLLNSTSIRISDVFLRRYGQDVCGDWTRNGISAHYDVYSRVTAVMALDDVASQGTNGLFTTHVSYHSKNGGGGRGAKTSNHAALRRFFPLDRGDCVVHTWDVLHGVDVEPGIDRTSLIVWFTEGDDDDDDDDDEAAISPWLRNHPNLETDDVLQFVLASALSSA